LGHDLDERGGDVVWVRRGEAYPPDPVDAGDGAEQPCEVPVSIPVGVDRLPEEHDLGDPLLRDPADLVEDPRRVTILLGAAHVRDDAVRAAVVAPALDRHPRGDARASPDLEAFVVLMRLE